MKINVLIIVLLLLPVLNARAQYIVPFSGSNTITACSGTVQDHAGSSNYSNSANGYLVINPATANSLVRLTFTQFTTEANYDYVTVFNGVGTGGTVLYGPTSGSPALPTITTTSGPLTIRFTSDGSVVAAGFTANISCIGCTNASLYPAAFNAPSTNTAYTISTCQYQSEYNQMEVASPSTFTSTASVAGTFITVRSGTYNGPLVGYGTTPLTWTAAAAGTYYIHYNTNISCGTATSCMTSTITCTTCPDFDLTANPCATVTHASTTVGAGDNCGLRGGNDREYRITLPVGGTWRFSLCGGASWDTYLYLTSARCGGTTLGSNDDFCSVQSQIDYTTSTGGVVYLDVEPYSSGTTGAYTLNVSLVPNSPVTAFGSNQWSVYAYNGQDLNLANVSYAGTYTETALSYDSQTKWVTSGTPSSTTGYSGNVVGIDCHTVVYKRQGFPVGNYALSIPAHDDDIRVYVNGTQVFEHIGCCDAHPNFWCGSLNATSTIEVRHSEGGGGSQQALTLTSTGDPNVFGSNTWNIYTYAGTSFNTYYGYATNSTSSEFNIGAFGMGVASNPSVLSGYIGCSPGNDNWSIQAKRQGFTCGVYNVIGRSHDDNVQLFIDYDGNGTFDYTSANFTCCNQAGFVNQTLWSGTLTSASRVQINLVEGGGDAYVDIDFNLATPAVNGGTIAGIVNGISICTGGDPGAFTSSAAASGGTVGTTNGGAFAYQWEQSVNGGAYGNIAGATLATYDPPALTTGTYIYRRRATDQCGNTNVSNTIQVNVVADPSISVSGATTICNDGFSTANLTANITGGTGCSPQWQISTDNVSFSDIAGATSTTYNTGTLTATRYYRARTVCGIGCDAATSASITVTVTQPPGTPGVYGSNTWNIYTYNGFNFNNYVGYVTNSTSSEFNIGAFGMGITQSPSNMAGYTGCPTQSGDNWSFRAQRQGFTCNVYNVNLMGYDDNYTLNIDYDGNGTIDFTTSGTCCDAGLGTKWTGVLNSTSKVEIILQENTGNAYIDIDFSPMALAIGSGTIGGITDATTICTGGDPGAFTNAAGASGGTVGYTNGGSYSYTWESSVTSSSSGFLSIGGATSATYDPPTLTQTTWFRRKVTDTCGNTAYSNVIQVIVVADPSATTPTYSNTTICAGGSTVVSTTASGGTGSYTYQWQYFNGSTWGNVVNGTPTGSTYTNATTASMTISGITAPASYQYRCIVGTTGTGCDATTTSGATLTVVADPTLSTPSLTNATICIGSSTAISTSLSGGTGTFTYQWQYSADGSTGWANVATGTPVGYTYTNATTATLNIATTNSASPATVYYRCVLTTNTPSGAGCDATTTNAILTLVADPVSPTSATKSPNATSVCEGATLTISAPTGGSPGVSCTLEYRYTQDGGISYSTPSTSIPVLTANLGGYDAIQVRYNNCLAGCETSSWTELAQWTVIADPVITGTTQPTNPICPGGNGVFSVTATGGTDGSGATVRTFQWQYSADGSTGWTNVTNGTPAGMNYTNATTATLTASTTNALTPADTYYYRCIVGATGSDCATVTSIVLSMTVNAEATAPTATKSPNVTDVCVGTSLTLTNPTLGSGGAGTQTFEYSTTGATPWNTTVPTVSAIVGSNSIWIRTNPTGSGCNISPSTQYSWTGIAYPSGGTIAPVTFCAGASATATVTGVSNATQYLWSLPTGLSGSSTTSSISLSSSTPSTYTITVTPQNVSGGTTCAGTPITGTITVNAIHSLILTSGNSSQTVCQNTAIADITYSVGGGATGASVSGLPSGVTGSYSGGVFTISGTPSASGTFNYTVTTSGNSCTIATATGTITVNAIHSLSLTSGNSSQTVCQNTAITDITYSVGGGATGASVSGLPSGVTGSYSGGVFTISGTPSASGTFNYTVTTSGNSCTIATATGTITVNAIHSLILTSGNSSQTVCQNTAITDITYSVGGGATGASVSGLPSGVTGSYSGGVFTISGTPSASGTFNYTVTTSGNSCTIATATGTITVNAIHSLSLTSGNSSQTVCQNTAITDITYSVGGGATGASVSGLPSGVTGSYSGGVFTISGTPSASGTFNYTVTTSGNSCTIATATGTITVNAIHSLSLTSGNSSQTVCQNTAIADITYSVGGGATGASVSGLPSGVTGSYSGGVFTISGTPSASGTFNYTVTTSGNSCTIATATGTITVNAIHSLSLTSGNSSQTVCQNTVIADITYSVGGGATGASVSGLPSGVTGSYSGGVFTISGTPSASGTFNYTVTTSGNSCTIATATGTITVNPTPTATAPANQTYCSGENTAPISLSGTPAGVAFNISGGAAVGLANQTNVTTIPTFTAIAGTAVINITPIANGCTGSAVTYTVTVYDPLNYGTISSGDETICTNTGDPANIALSVVPSGGAGTFTYQWYYQDGVVTCPSGTSTIGWTLIAGATGNSYDPPSGLTGSRTYALMVDVSGTPDCSVATWANSCRKITAISCCTPPSLLTYTPTSASYCNNVAISPLNATVSGTMPMSFSVSPALPTGLSLNTTTGQISGTPILASPATDYTVTATNACGTTTATVNITVFDVVSYGSVDAAPETICIGGDPANITLSAAPSGGAGTFTYQWYYQDGVVTCPSGTSTIGWTLIAGATGNSYDPPSGLAGSRTYAVIVDVSGTPDCGIATWASNCRQVTVVADPVVTISGNSEVCEGGSVTLTANVIGGTGTTIYTWKRNGSLVGSNSATYTTDNSLSAGSYTYTVEISQSSGCSATSVGVSSDVVLDPVVTISGNGVVCEGGSVTLTANVTGGTGTTIYTWKRNGSLVGSNSATYTTDNSLSAGSYTYTVEISQSSGCSATSVGVSSDVVLDPVVTISGNSEVCEGGSVMLTANVIGGTGTTTYTWKRNGSLVGSNSATYTTDNGLSAGSYTYTVEVSQSSGCSATSVGVSSDVVLDPIAQTINPNIPSGTVVCAGYALSATFSGGSGGAGAVVDEYEYSIDGGSNWAIYTAGTTIATSGLDGANIVQVRTRRTASASGCTASNYNVVSWTVVVNPAISLTAGAYTQTVCAGTNLSWTVSGLPGTGTCGYTWESSADGTSGWTAIAGENTATYSHVFATAGTYYYRAVFSCDGLGCIDAASNVIAVTVNNNPVPAFSSPDLSVCANETGVTYTLGTTYNNYVWSVTGGTIASGGGAGDNSVTVDWGAAGNGTVNVTVTDSNSCIGNVTANVVINPRPVVTYCLVPDYCLGDEGQISLNIQGGTPPYVISWLPIEGSPTTPATLNSDGLFTVTGLTGNTDYNFTVIDAVGCGIEP